MRRTVYLVYPSTQVEQVDKWCCRTTVIPVDTVGYNITSEDVRGLNLQNTAVGWWAWYVQISADYAILDPGHTTTNTRYIVCPIATLS